MTEQISVELTGSNLVAIRQNSLDNFIDERPLKNAHKVKMADSNENVMSLFGHGHLRLFGGATQNRNTYPE